MLCYKLLMMRIEISGPSQIFVDDMSVIHKTQRLESALNKESNSICYHVIRESVAMGESLVDKNHGELTEVATFGEHVSL